MSTKRAAAKKQGKGPTTPDPVVKEAEMPEEMQKMAFEKAWEALQEHPIEKDVATAVKKHFDETFGGTWHCIIGKSFGCSITHDTQYLVFFVFGEHHILLFKSYE